MGWLTRENYRYFYMSQRDGQKVRNTHLGSGAAASLAAIVTEIRQRERLDRRLAQTDPAEACDAVRREVVTVATNLRTEVFEAMHKAGYHRLDRHWRRRRT